MQSSLATIAGKLNRIISSSRQELFFGQRMIGFATSTGRTADPAIHSEEPELSCVGLDGSPWPEDVEETSMKEQRREQAEDQREYFKHHKASPLSDIEIADTRKPVTRASDGTGGKDAFGYDQAGGVLVFSPEQIDSAEDSLRRAMEIFRANAMRGDPDSPHGRVLRQLRGEYW